MAGREKLGRSVHAIVLAGGALLGPASVYAALPAFPGAEGPGSDATGGRAGDVYHVTSLADDRNGTTLGTLRNALVTAPASGRTIVFDIGGVIHLVPDVNRSTGTWLKTGNSNITIAGQTAPGPGITIIGQGTKLSGSNVIFRNIKMRPGQDQTRPGVLTNDGFSNYLQNSIVDHVSVSWADDEALSSTDFVSNTTVQYSIISEGLNYTLADGTDHAMGALISSQNNDAKISYHHNFFTQLRTRNPRLGSEAGTGAITNFSNNLIYNWTGRAGYSIDAKPSRTNYLANYYVAGPNTGSSDKVFYSPDTNTQIYHANTNMVDMNKTGGINGVTFGFTGNQFQGAFAQAATPFDVASGYVQSATDAVPQVLGYAGAQWWARDYIDARLVADPTAGTGSIINTINDARKSPDPTLTYDATGFPQFAAVSRPADFDTDRDGMPDAWEQAHGLNAAVADNADDFDTDGYTNLEEYLNDLGAFPAPRALSFSTAGGRYEVGTNWDSSWQPSAYDEARLNGGVVTLSSVGQHAKNLKIATTLGNAARLDVSNGWIDITESLYVGPGGAGTLVQTGGTVVAGKSVILGGTTGASGNYTLAGGILSTPLLTKGATGGAFTFNGGTLHADDVTFDLVNGGGTLAPGVGVGKTRVRGKLTLAAGAVEIQVASATSFDTLAVDGQLTLGGKLDVQFLNGFSAALGQRFLIGTAGSFTGAFGSITPGFAAETSGGNLFLVAVPEPTGAAAVLLLAGSNLVRRGRRRVL